MYTTEPIVVARPHYATFKKQIQHQRQLEEIGTDVDTLAGLALVLFTPNVLLDPSTPTEENPNCLVEK